MLRAKRGEATNINFIVFGLTRSGLEPTTYRTQGEHANRYTTDAVFGVGNRIEEIIRKPNTNCVV